MKVLELFAGSRSIGKAAEQLGMEVFSSDINNFEGINYVTDIRDFDVSKVPFKPDVIWASPPCTYFSVASIGKHWNKDNTPKSDNAMLGVEFVQKTIDIIKELQPTYWFIENPRGKLRKLDVINGLNDMWYPYVYRYTVTYCQYGDSRMKPTDIWTNNPYWEPRPMCKNGDKCHVSAPRGSQTGTQGLKGNYERSKLPEELCLEILESAQIPLL
jgi:hypothetical protein